MIMEVIKTDVVEKLKNELCKFASDKLHADYVDLLSIISIIDKYNTHAGVIEGIPIDCITIHNRVLALRYDENYTLDDVNRIFVNVRDTIRDNTTSVICVPSDMTIQTMYTEEFGKFIHELLAVYQLNHQQTARVEYSQMYRRPFDESRAWNWLNEEIMRNFQLNIQRNIFGQE